MKRARASKITDDNPEGVLSATPGARTPNRRIKSRRTYVSRRLPGSHFEFKIGSTDDLRLRETSCYSLQLLDKLLHFPGPARLVLHPPQPSSWGSGMPILEEWAVSTCCTARPANTTSAGALTWSGGSLSTSEALAPKPLHAGSTETCGSTSRPLGRDAIRSSSAL